MKETPLTEIHRNSGARLVEFAGYLMPIQYEGIVKEHLAVRQAAGIFDVSHMGHFRISDATVSRFLSRPLQSIPVGESTYALIMNEGGGIEDDCIVYRIAEDDWHMVVNAARKEHDARYLKKIEVMSELAMIALQGPDALRIAGEICDRKTFARDVTVLGVPVKLTARTGYTGEDGYEFILAPDNARKLWNKLTDAGVTPCGLGARDSLRIEAGLPLYGTDMDEETFPSEAGLSFAVDKEHTELIANKALEKKQPVHKRAGLLLEKGPVPRTGCPVLDEAGNEIGIVTSGTFSPVLETGVAIARIRRDEAEPASVKIRNNACSCEVVKLPFYRRKK